MPRYLSAKTLKAEIKAVRDVGQRMAVWCFKLSRDPAISVEARGELTKLFIDYEAVPHSSAESLKAKLAVTPQSFGVGWREKHGADLVKRSPVATKTATRPPVK